MNFQILILLIVVIAIPVFNRLLFETKRKRRREYYRNVYLKSGEWKRKRYVVLKRDNWRCVYCGARATQVHHKRYAKKNIGKEPIKWLVSVCKSCHDAKHR
ncbi:HNH endonuclease [Galbibacter sp. EGI 63066]|uniref:HNH endonuclease n=1 Tax=Galbibacter sp. EGI 63066 TaxID=2993559 RepID=UPI003A5210C5